MKIDEGTFSVAAFRDQRVLYLAGEWVSRRDLIRYVANEKSGVHSGQEDKLAHKSTISKLEMMMSVTTSSSNGRIEVTLVDAPTDAPISTYQKNATNPVLMYMYLTAAALVRSPDIERLAETIRQELA